MSVSQPYDQQSALGQIPSSPPKKLLPAFPTMGKFVTGEANGITHVYRDEDDVLMPGIMSSSPVKRSHVTAFGPGSSSSMAHEKSPPPSSPCARSDSPGRDESAECAPADEEDKLQLASMIQREPRNALCSLPIVNLKRPSASHLNALIMEKRVQQNKDLLSKPTAQELLAIMGEYYPPVAVGRSSLQSQVVLSRSNRQISRRHVTTWYDLDHQVIAISCCGWNGCRVMRTGRVFRTPENQTLLQEAKVKYGDIFEPNSEHKDGQENAESSTTSFGTFLFKNDRMEVDANEIVVDVRGERFMIRLTEEEDGATANEDAEMTTDETDDEELLPLSSVSETQLNVKRQKVDKPVVKAVTAVTPAKTVTTATTSKTATSTTPSKFLASVQSKENHTPTTHKTPKPNHKPVLKTVKVMKPIVRPVNRPAGRLEKPQLLSEHKKAEVKPKVAETKPKVTELESKPVSNPMVKDEPESNAVETMVTEAKTVEVVAKVSETTELNKVLKPEQKEVKSKDVKAPMTKPVVSKTAKVSKTELKEVKFEDSNVSKAEPRDVSKSKNSKPKVVSEKVAPTEKLVETKKEVSKSAQKTVSIERTRETTPVLQMTKTTPKATPKATPKSASSTPKKNTKPVQVETPLSPSKIDIKAIRNLVCNHLAFSRLSCTPLQTVMGVSPKISMVPKKQLQQILRDIECIGIIHREGKDASGKPLEEEYYYVPEKDADQDRVKLVNETKGGAGVRSCRKVHKQYYWKKPTL